MDVLVLSIAVALVAVQNFVQSLYIAKLRKRASDLEKGLIKVAVLLKQITEIQSILVNRSGKEKK